MAKKKTTKKEDPVQEETSVETEETESDEEVVPKPAQRYFIEKYLNEYRPDLDFMRREMLIGLFHGVTKTADQWRDTVESELNRRLQ